MISTAIAPENLSPLTSVIAEKMPISLKKGQPFITQPKTVTRNVGAVLPAIGSPIRWYISIRRNQIKKWFIAD
jgi:hypothetical protein